MRPINSAPKLNKVLETIVKLQLNEHVERNDILFEHQSAYREKHSCETSLNFVVNEWKQKKGEKRKIVAVFLDLGKAFEIETVDRTILLKVLQ